MRRGGAKRGRMGRGEAGRGEARRGEARQAGGRWGEGGGNVDEDVRRLRFGELVCILIDRILLLSLFSI